MSTASLLTILTQIPSLHLFFRQDLPYVAWAGLGLDSTILPLGAFQALGMLHFPVLSYSWLASLDYFIHTFSPTKIGTISNCLLSFCHCCFFVCFIFREDVGECVWRRVCSISRKHFLIQFRLAWNPPCSPGWKSYLSLLSINTSGS